MDTPIGNQDSKANHYLELEDVTLLVEEVPAPRLRNELIVMLLYDADIRLSELTQIRLEDIDRDERTIDIPALKSSKPRKATYGLNRTGRLLDDWLDGGYRDAAKYARGSPYLLPTDMGIQMDSCTVTNIVIQAAENIQCDDAKIPTTLFFKRGEN